MKAIISFLLFFCLFFSSSNVSYSDDESRDSAKTLPPIISFLLDEARENGIQIRRKIISAGSFHTCMIVKQGEVVCWGSNEPSTFSQPLPDVRLIPNIDSAIDISSGQDTTCVILENTQVACWGGSFEDSLIYSAEPVYLSDIDSDRNLSGVNSVSVGANGLICVSLLDGKVVCYSSSLAEPMLIDGVEGAVKVTVGNFVNNCALIIDGSVKCWGLAGPHLGNGQYNQLTPTADLESFFDPVNVLNINNSAIDVVTGMFHACALLSNFETRCWGANGLGELGNGESGFDPLQTSSSPVKQKWTSTGGVTQVVVSSLSSYTCALFIDGHVECAGNNGLGQLGNGEGEFGLISPDPVRVENLGPKRITDITVNRADYTCVSLENDQAKCWGNDDHFPDDQFDTVSSEAITTPTLVEGIAELL